MRLRGMAIRYFLCIMLVIGYMLPATAIAHEEDTDYVELLPNVVPESWRGEVKVDRYFVDEGYNLGMQLLNERYEKIYPTEKNFSKSSLYLQFMNITDDAYNVQLTVYVDGVASNFCASEQKMAMLEFELLGNTYDIYSIRDFWPIDDKEHSIYFHVTYENNTAGLQSGIYMPECMGYCLASVDDLYAEKNMQLSGEAVYKIREIDADTSFGSGTQVFLAEPQMKIGSYHIGSIEVKDGKATLRIIGSGTPGVYGISVFRGDELIAAYRYILQDGEIFLKKTDIECNVGDKIQAIIVPIDLETKMASVSTVVHVEKER